MSLLALLLVSASCFLHVGWNLFGKKISPTPAFFTLAYCIGSWVLLPLIAPSLDKLTLMSPDFWRLLGLSAVCQAFYSWSLAGAYASGDISQTYPLARALPVLMVALASFWLYPAAQLSAVETLAMLVVVVGALLLPMQHLRDFRLSHYLNRASGWAVAAALATTGYSLLDASAIHLMRASVSTGSDLSLALLYIWLQGAGSLLVLLPVQLCRRHWRASLFSVAQANWKMAGLSGCMMLLTYALILWAMQYADNVSHVVAFRQLSIPLGVFVGIWLLDEGSTRMKWGGTLLILAGLVLLALHQGG
jgi:drug/metabolite transporter (DMT)-like permease